MISWSEGKELAANNTAAGAATDDDWGAAWGVDGEEESSEIKDTAMRGQEEDDGADAWGWDDEDQSAEKEDPKVSNDAEPPADDEDDAVDAWGWGDEDAPEPAPEPEPKQQPPKKSPKKKVKTASPAQNDSREMVLKETYHISSMPDPVLELISAILEDGAALTKSE